jgi:hypothetical protein
MRTIAILFVLGLFFIGLGEFYFSSGRSADERIGGILPTFIGGILLAVDAVLLIVFLIRRRKSRKPTSSV